MREEREQNTVKDEDKYEPEFCLDDDDDSNDAKPHFKDEGSNRYVTTWFTGVTNSIVILRVESI